MASRYVTGGASFYSVQVCARPCPSSWYAWLAVAAAVAVLCSSGDKLLCRSRFARFLSAVVAIFAGHAFVSLVLSLRADEPVQIAAKVEGYCLEMPADTFTWARQAIEHRQLQKGLSFLSSQMPIDTSASFHLAAINASHPVVVPVGAVETKQWSQPEACDSIAYFVACMVKIGLTGSALVHLFLFFAAIAVFKRACRLRCAAYRTGLLKWNCSGRCKSACQRAAPAPPHEPATKEMA